MCYINGNGTERNGTERNGTERNVAIEKTNIHVLFTLLFAVGSDISILKAPMAAAISPFMSPLSPPNP